MKQGKKFYFQLFLYTFRLSAFTFGGGYVIVSLMKKLFVEKLGWVSEQEMLDFTAIAQASPGMMAVNTSVLLGYHLAGIPGAIVSVFGTVLPPLFILSVISVVYDAFIANIMVKNVLHSMQAAVCAIIIDVVMMMGSAVTKEKNPLSLALMPLAFVAVAILNVNVVFVVLACILIGVGSILLGSKKEVR